MSRALPLSVSLSSPVISSQDTFIRPALPFLEEAHSPPHTGEMVRSSVSPNMHFHLTQEGGHHPPPSQAEVERKNKKNADKYGRVGRLGSG